jgi:hypothetical protein
MIKAILIIIPILPMLLISTILYYTTSFLRWMNRKVMNLTEKYMIYYKIDEND